MNSNPTKISALAIIYNEEHNIREYLQNMSFADEIVVVDSFSTDATPQIIKDEFPHVRFYQRVFDDFSSQRNYTIKLATNDWVVFFDADERVSQKGIAEILRKISSIPEEVAFLVKRTFYYEGKPLINNSVNTDKTIRLFRKSKCWYSKKLVHEKLIIEGKTGLLKAAIDHYSFKNKEEFLSKRLMYSKLKAKELLDKNINPNFYHFSIRPRFRFFKYYILKFGFINGRRGYEIANILSKDEYMRYVYLTEMQQAEPQLLKLTILVIQQKMIGDVLVSSIICNNLKNIYSASSIEYLIYPFTQPVVENNPNIDKVILFDNKYRRNKWLFLKFLFETRREKYDIIIDAYGILESNLIVAFSGAKQKIGFYKRYTSFLYTDTVKELKTPLSIAGLALDNRLQLLKVLQPQAVLQSRPKIFMSDTEIENGRAIVEHNRLNTSSKLYMIGVLGSGNNKTYPAAYMATLLDVIAQKDVCLIFNYVPTQLEQAIEIYNLCNADTKAKIKMDIIPGSIREFLSILYHCDALISNEGGAVNMAKAINIPTFTIFSTWINKDAWNSFEDGTTTVSVHLNDFKPELYGGNLPKEMKKDALKLYSEFTPDLILPALRRYIELN